MRAIPVADASPNGRILVIDDEPNVLKALSRSLSGRGFEVSTATHVPRRLSCRACSRRMPSSATCACRA